MNFNEYLTASPEKIKEIFHFYLSFLSDFSSKKFPYEDELKLKGAGNKFIITVYRDDYFGKEERKVYNDILDTFIADLKAFRKLDTYSKLTLYFPINRKKRGLLRIQNSFHSIYSKTLELISNSNKESNYRDILEINDFYKPDNSNKTKIKELIGEAIDLIHQDTSLSEKSKKKLIENLKNIIEELDRENVNWVRFLGKIKESVIVLSALGSLIGGLSPLLTARDKLEETTTVVQNTSINVSYNVISQTYNIQNIKQITNINQIFQLPELSENNKNVQDIDEFEDVETNN